MSDSPSKLRIRIIDLSIVIVGLIFFIAGNSFSFIFLKVDIDSILANLGALLIIVALLQWLFDNYVRESFFREIREEMLGSKRVTESGICDFHANSHTVEFDEHFLSSQDVTIGVNYSAKLIDNSIDLLEKRTKERKKTTILVLNPECVAAKYIAEAYHGKPDIKDKIEAIEVRARQFDPSGDHITIKKVISLFKYSFVRFDGRIWIVFGTNSPGRRQVPGFFVRKGGTWYDHFERDIESLENA